MQHFLPGHTAILRVNTSTPVKEKRFQVSCLRSSNNSNEQPEWRSVDTQNVLTYLLTYSTEQTPSWKDNRFSVSQEIPRTLWNPKVHCRTHKCSPCVPILSQLDPVHTLASHFLNINPNIFPSKPAYPKWSPSLRPPHQNHVYASSLTHTRYMPHPSHSPFYHPNNIEWGIEIIKLLTM